MTSNMALMGMAAFKKKVPLYSYPMNITIVFFGTFLTPQNPIADCRLTRFLGNLFGSLFVAGIFGFYSGLFTGPYKAWAIAFATTKIVPPTWANILVRGMAVRPTSSPASVADRS